MGSGGQIHALACPHKNVKRAGMGTKSGFTRAIRSLFRRLSPGDLDNVIRLIDGSYILHSVMRQEDLGYECFFADPAVPGQMDELAAKITVAMMKFVAPLQAEPRNSVWFLEGRIAKPRHESAAKSRSGRLSDAIKKRHRGEESKMGRKFARRRWGGFRRVISAVYGRPPPELTQLIGRKLAELGFAVSYDDHLEADFRICDFAAQSKLSSLAVLDGNSTQTIQRNSGSVMVVASDSDFVALSPPQSVDRMAKIQHGVVSVVEKGDVVKSLELEDPFKLLLAYCIAGCDNVTAHVNQVGWGRAYKFVANSDISLNSMDSLAAVPLSRGDSETKQQMANEIRNVLEQFGWRSTHYSFSGSLNRHIVWPEGSEAVRFASEMHEGRYVRPAVYRIICEKEPDSDKVLPPSPPKPGKTPPLPKGTKAPTFPSAYSIANPFTILEFEAVAKDSYKKKLHLPKSERDAKPTDDGDSDGESVVSEQALEGRPRKKRRTGSKAAQQIGGASKSKSNKTQRRGGTSKGNKTQRKGGGSGSRRAGGNKAQQTAKQTPIRRSTRLAEKDPPHAVEPVALAEPVTKSANRAPRGKKPRGRRRRAKPGKARPKVPRQRNGPAKPPMNLVAVHTKGGSETVAKKKRMSLGRNYSHTTVAIGGLAKVIAETVAKTVDDDDCASKLELGKDVVAKFAADVSYFKWSYFA